MPQNHENERIPTHDDKTNNQLDFFGFAYWPRLISEKLRASKVGNTYYKTVVLCIKWAVTT